jgi:outer membrane protein OmpA-like peptidoglycan-associated protein
MLERKVQTVKGDDFFSALAIGYNELAKWEEEQYDWKDSEIFARKGLKALQHEYVLPSDPISYKIEDYITLNELLNAYDELNETLTTKVKFQFPLKSAHTQLVYDCWLEQAEEKWQKGDIRECREQYYISMQGLKEAIAIEQEVETEAIKKDLRLNRYYNVHFDFNKHNIDFEAREQLNEVIYYLTTLENYKIILAGHTDLIGSEKANLILSADRTKSVKEYLVLQGIAAEKFIKEQAEGNKMLKIPTESGGASDRANRRVEIFIIPLKK